jgi:hypothetical protein
MAMRRILPEPTSRATKPFVVALIALAIAGGSFAVVQAATKPAVATPSISSGPADPTNQTSASFTFTDAQAGVSFQCALDAAAFTACTSPTSYPGPLGEGTHKFQVRAVDVRGQTSAPAGWQWTVDTTPPPAPQLTATPAALTNQTSASFGFTDAQAGVGYRCALDAAAFTACTSPTSYPGPLGEGSHSFSVKAVDAAGNLGAATSFTWRVDLTPPPAPVIGSGPDNPTTATTATFAFADAEAGAAFRCRLDGGAYASCTSPKSYSGLSVATHTFQVQALDAAGNASAAASASWTVQAPLSNLTLGGSLTQLLYPGATAALNVRITNPFSFDVNVAQLTVTVRPATTRNGQPNPACDGTTNLKVLRQYSGPSPLKVKSSRTVSLADLGVAQSQWPQLQMPDLPVNQDACKNTTFTFDYAATATKVTS